ncbi:MAG: hypothetical protein ACTS3T_13415 [Almyronema sp.]
MSRSQWFAAVTVTACSAVALNVLFRGQQPHLVAAAERLAAEISPLENTFRRHLSRTPLLVSRPVYLLAHATAEKFDSLAEPLSQSEITLAGVGPLKIGMALSEVAEFTAAPLIPTVESNSSCQYFRLQQANVDLGLMVVEDAIIRIDVWAGAQLKTPSGAHLGATAADIQEIYPSQIEVSDRPLGGQYLTLVPQTESERLFRLVFETDASGKVVQVRTGQFPAVTWPGSCS